jgi:TfoX/Sxy family transcriptional regulator of competence genes
MSYDEKLAGRVRRLLSERGGDVSERKMFGGLCFMVNGAMCCGVLKHDLIVRVGPERHAEALASPNARPFDFTGRPSKGIVYVEPAGVQTAAQLRKWLDAALVFHVPKEQPVKRKAAQARR